MRRLESINLSNNIHNHRMKKLKGEFDLINRLTHEYKDEN